MAFTELYCQTTGSNLNSGSTTSDTAAQTYVSSLVAGWNSATGVFEVASGNPSGDGVAVGDFASIYVTAGATVATFVARVTARTTTTITVSLTAKSGTAPTTDILSLTTCKIGGAWKGPNAAVGFPFGFITSALVNTSSHWPRVNVKNDATYSITAVVTHATSTVRFQGYTSTVGDGGRAVIEGPATGAAITLLNITSAATVLSLHSFVFQVNGDSGSADGVIVANARVIIENCVFRNLRGNGLNSSGSVVVESEAYDCNQSNTASQGAFYNVVSGGTYIRCVAHDNTGSNTAGFYTTTQATYLRCIADSNGGMGFRSPNNVSAALVNCDAYNNASHGINLNGSGGIYVANCNLIKNGGWGVLLGLQQGTVANCGFGAGTQANTSGTLSQTGGMSIEVGSITYTTDLTPWVDPANGDFRINLAAAKGTGRGAFLQTAPSYAGTISYPDIGAAQHFETAGGFFIG